jgi:hypothetical protein
MRKFAPLALSAIALLALAGCSGGSGDAAGGDSQSVADACAIANEKMSAVQSEMTESLSGLSSGDYSAASDTMSALSDSLDAALDEISNAEVGDVLDRVSVEVDAIGSSIEELGAAGTDTDKISEISDTMTESATNLQTAGNELVELCS